MDAQPKLFEIYESGDPYSRAWDCSECDSGFDADTAIYCGDISGKFSKTRLTSYLRRTYPGCKIRDRNRVHTARLHAAYTLGT